MPIIPGVSKAARRMEALNKSADAALIGFLSSSNKQGSMTAVQIAAKWLELRNALDAVMPD